MKMQDTNKSFDEAIRSMLENVEEEVPSHILDDVFSRHLKDMRMYR